MEDRGYAQVRRQLRPSSESQFHRFCNSALCHFSLGSFILFQAEEREIDAAVPEPVNMGEEDEAIIKDEKDIRSRKDRPTGSIHFGDGDFDVVDEFGDATWNEVFRTCCCHSPAEWGVISIGIFFVCFFLYFFLFGLSLLGNGAKVMTGCKAGELFGDDTNPIAGLMVGILATVLLQSSSTTTSIIVSLTGSAISVRQGIYMIMGANIGTSVTNTIVAIGQMGDGDQLERAFAGATVHDMFNFMAVAILFRSKLADTFYLTKAMVKNANPEKGEKWEGPIKKLVAPLGDRIIISNKKIIEAVAEDADGNDSCSVGGGFYPIICDGTPTYDSCSSVGLIGCNKLTGDCPSFFSVNATQSDDKVSEVSFSSFRSASFSFCLILVASRRCFWACPPVLLQVLT
jgi:sodium-dependent phosphate cotransporter